MEMKYLILVYNLFFLVFCIGCNSLIVKDQSFDPENVGSSWQNIYGGNHNDVPQSIIKTADGGYVIGGYSYSSNLSKHGNKGKADIYLLKINATGKILWEKSFGTVRDERAKVLIESNSGEILVAG